MHVAQNWRINAQRYALKGVRCQHCDQVIFPPREICPHCAQQENRQAQTAKETTPLVVNFDSIRYERAAR